MERSSLLLVIDSKMAVDDSPVTTSMVMEVAVEVTLGVLVEGRDGEAIIVI